MMITHLKHVLIFSAFLLICSANAERLVPALLKNLLAYVFGVDFETNYNDQELNPNETYDFIVIGSGPSGSVLANRLAEVPGWNVLLLEAGEEPGPFVDIPALCESGQFSKYDWGYRTESEEGYCWGCEGHNMQWGHGKVLGGTSITNFMIYVHGNRYDYDKWAALGNPGWSYDEVLPHFISLEDTHVKIRDDSYHGYNGELTISDVPYRSTVSGVYIKAAEEAGYDYVDYNGARQNGVSYVQATLRDGSRCSAEKSFLRPIRDKPNLTILTEARVTKILINSEKREAYGVEFYKNNHIQKAFARKEVISSAGALNSPQLLMLSGIGPRKELKSLGIPVIKNLPVGKKMYDHATYAGLIIQLDKEIGLEPVLQVLSNVSNYQNYALYGKGPFTSIGSVETLTYIKTNCSSDRTTRPDVELIQLSISLNFDKGVVLRKMFNIPEKLYDQFWKPYEDVPTFQILPMLLHPKSVGHIELRSSNPFDPPKFYANYFSDPQNLDIKSFIESIREIQRIIQSPSLQQYGARLVQKSLPGCEKQLFDSDEYWECCLRTLIGSLWHQFSTCKMGPKNDPEAVVDPQLRVHGINRLRVVDTSVIPVTLSAHTVGVAYMIGEKGASLIKTTHLKHVLIFNALLLIYSANADRLVPTLLRNLIVSVFGVNLGTKYNDQELQPNETYDFIVIGSGPSGSVLANRLAEKSNWNVLLLEAGEEPGPLTDIPALCEIGVLSKYDWGYRTESEEGFCWGCEGRNMQWGHGKVLGGTSITNFMIYVHGNRYDYDKWAALGNPGWSYDEVLPHFISLEDTHVEIVDEEYHGYNGELTITDVPYRSTLSGVYIKAAEEAGYDYVDYNGASQNGVSYVQGTLKEGSRCSAEKSFLIPIREKPNLKILTEARVTKILINQTTNEAYGVEFYKNNQIQTAFASKEVISSAGALNSPQLLMLSGIGPREELESLGISVIKDLPVGKKMYDHAAFYGLVIQIDQYIGLEPILQLLTNVSNYVNYAFFGKGPLTAIGTVETLTYIKTNYSLDKTFRPDVELMQLALSMDYDKGIMFRKPFNVPEGMYDQFWKLFENIPTFQICPLLLHPRSVGHIELRSSNPFDSPKFYANYFSDPENLDIKTFIASIREIQRIIQSPALQAYGAKLVEQPLPGCETQLFDSDEYWECCLRTVVGSIWHQVSTCKMGPDTDSEAVVDPQLRVYGISRLRVVDTSVIPVTLSAHNVAAAYMIGEKGASLIKERWDI